MKTIPYNFQTNKRKLLSNRMSQIIFLEYYIIKVNQLNNIAKDTLDEWICFFEKQRSQR